MTYVDTDYLLALAKDEDWLKESAVKLKLESGEIETSAFTLVELLFYAHKHGRNPEELVAIASALVGKIRPLTPTQVRAASHYMKKFGLNPGDAIHAASLEVNEEMVTSDKKLKKLEEFGFKVRKLK